jgi:tetratricopeptide (TPR) repeat protein
MGETDRTQRRGGGPRAVLLMAVVLALSLFSAYRLAQVVVLGGLHTDRKLAATVQAVNQVSELPTREAEETLASANDNARLVMAARPLAQEAHLLAYRLARLEGKRVEAELALNRCAETRPADPMIAFKQGSFLLENGRFREGLIAFRRSLQLDSEYLDQIYDVCMGIFFQRYEMFRSIFPDDPTVRHRLAERLRHSGLVRESITEFQACLARMPDSAQVYFDLSRAHKAGGDIVSALAALEAAIRLAPDRKDYACERGECLLQLGRVDEAIALCRSLVAVRPDFKQAYVLLARCHEMRDEPWEAIRIYRETLWRTREKGSIHQLIGDLYLRMGKTRQAQEEYQAGLRLAINEYSRKSALLRLGIFHEKRGMLDEAMEALVEAEAIRPDSRDLDQPVLDAITRVRTLIEAGAG